MATGKNGRTKARAVTECRHTPPPREHGGRRKLWAFSVLDLAALVGKSERAVHADIKAGALDPRDLADVVRYAQGART